MTDLFTCKHPNTEIVERYYPEPVGNINVEVCVACQKEI